MIQRIPTLQTLDRLALKHIFEGLSYEDRKLLEEGIDQQARKKPMTTYNKLWLDKIIRCLIKNERGGYNKIKETLVKHDVCYENIFRAGLE